MCTPHAAKPTSDERDDEHRGQHPQLPSKAMLARRWPSLKINRLSWRWVDDHSGEKGEDLTTLLAFLKKGAR